jgi:hypothetical protein
VSFSNPLSRAKLYPSKEQESSHKKLIAKRKAIITKSGILSNQVNDGFLEETKGRRKT